MRVCNGGDSNDLIRRERDWCSQRKMDICRTALGQQPTGIVIAQHHDPKPGRWLAKSMDMERKLLILPATVSDAC